MAETAVVYTMTHLVWGMLVLRESLFIAPGCVIVAKPIRILVIIIAIILDM